MPAKSCKTCYDLIENNKGDYCSSCREIINRGKRLHVSKFCSPRHFRESRALIEVMESELDSAYLYGFAIMGTY